MLTTQTRLALTPAEDAVLAAMGARYGRLLRQLYAYTAKHGGRVISHKAAFCRVHDLSSRAFNALRVDLQGRIDSVTELLTLRVADLAAQEKPLTQKLKRLETKFAAIKADRLSVPLSRYQSWRSQYDKAWRKREKGRRQLTALRARLAAPVPGIGFGSRALFAKQRELKANQYASREEWLADWRAARNHQVYFLGSSDETGGNQQATLHAEKDGTYSLRVRIPDALRAEGQGKYLYLSSLRFAFQDAELRAALARSQALTWRLHRDARGWRAFVSFNRPKAALTSTEARYGALGMDFNADHLAVTETDAHGNLKATWRFDFDAEVKHTAGQRRSSLSDALTQAVALAQDKALPLIIEALDFTQKKRQLAAMSPAQARRLSGLAYAQYRQLVESKCARLGVALYRVNPAYTSVAGRLKYAVKQGKSVHGAAAGVIARCGMGLGERPPQRGPLRAPSHGVTLDLPVPVRTAGSTQRISWAAWSRTVGRHLREHWLATRGPARGVRKAGHGKGCAHTQPPSRDNRTLGDKPAHPPR